MSNSKSLNDVIKESLNLSETEDLNEAYVAIPKKFNLSTENLSAMAKQVHTELYDAKVKNFNTVSAKLDTANRELTESLEGYRSLKHLEAEYLNSTYLHELYFNNISGEGTKLRMDSLTYMKLAQDFGTFDDWQKDFVAAAMVSQGWTVTAYNFYLGSYTNMVVDANTSNILVGCYPVICLDLFEHSFIGDYGTDRKKYIYKMMSEFNWDVIENRFKKSENLALVG